MVEKKEIKEITVKELFTGFDNRSSEELKKKYLEATIQPVDYVSFTTAVVQAENIVKLSSYDGKSNIKINSPKRFLLYAATIIDDYTNINIDAKDFANEYDGLCKRGIYKYILNIIPKDLLDQLDALVEMELNDLMTNEYETRAYITKQLGKIYPYIGEALNELIGKINVLFGDMSQDDLTELLNKVVKNE